MLKGDNLNKIDTVLVLWISNAFHLGYIGHIAALGSAASNTEVWKYIQIKTAAFLLQKAGSTNTVFFLPYSVSLFTKNYIFKETMSNI